MYKKGDLHLHTNASDGMLSPSELVISASKNQLDVIAITDHDTTKGLEEGILYGEKYNIKIIPGIELSTLYNGENIHLLGYFKDDTYKSSKFQIFLKEMHDHRALRGKKIIENLKTYFNIELDSEKLIRETKGIIARPHIAKAIIDAGYNYDYEYIFSNIINKDSPAYIPTKNITLSEGINILHEVNALVVLAHPVLIRHTPVEKVLEYNFDGIEAIYPLNSPEATDKYLNLAKNFNKIVTAGSDFHGIEENDKKHGKMGMTYLQEEYITIFLNKLNNC